MQPKNPHRKPARTAYVATTPGAVVVLTPDKHSIVITPDLAMKLLPELEKAAVEAHNADHGEVQYFPYLPANSHPL